MAEGVAPSGPPPVVPPYPYWMGAPSGVPPFYPYPSARQDHLAAVLIIVIVVLALILSFVLAQVAPLLLPPPAQNPGPLVILGPVLRDGGNATILVSSSAGNIAPSSLIMTLQANHSDPSPVGLPTSASTCSPVATGGYLFCVSWNDVDGNSLISAGDSFHVSGVTGPLPPATIFDFTLQSPGRTFTASVEWTTP